MARFNVISYLGSSTNYSDLALGFAKHYLGHLNIWRLLLAGNANPDIFVNGHMLAATVVFALFGVVVVV
jgi:hypothetical protein